MASSLTPSTVRVSKITDWSSKIFALKSARLTQIYLLPRSSPSHLSRSIATIIEDNLCCAGILSSKIVPCPTIPSGIKP